MRDTLFLGGDTRPSATRLSSPLVDGLRPPFEGLRACLRHTRCRMTGQDTWGQGPSPRSPIPCSRRLAVLPCELFQRIEARLRTRNAKVERFLVERPRLGDIGADPARTPGRKHVRIVGLSKGKCHGPLGCPF